MKKTALREIWESICQKSLNQPNIKIEYWMNKWINKIEDTSVVILKRNLHNHKKIPEYIFDLPVFGPSFLPISPCSPFTPLSPLVPFSPTSPFGPTSPGNPLPVSPFGPVSPFSPVSPLSPVAPLIPTGPCTPWSIFKVWL